MIDVGKQPALDVLKVPDTVLCVWTQKVTGTRFSALGLRESQKPSRLRKRRATMGVLIPIVAILAIFIGAPAIVFSFISNTKKNSNEVKKLQVQKEILELELKKEELQIKRLEEENKKYDLIIKS
jgi:hypothetical protein